MWFRALHRRSIRHVSGSNYTIIDATSPRLIDRAPAPDRVYVRLERQGRLRIRVWGMEHGGLRSEVVEAVVAARRSTGGGATLSLCIERDLRRGLGLD